MVTISSKKIGRFLFTCILIPIICVCDFYRDRPAFQDIINLAHLDHLCQDICFAGDSVTVVAIYADYPDYQPVPARGEGAACLDDAARAAVVYMRYIERFEAPQLLKRVKKLLKFVMAMQAEDGEFYNFIDPNFKINRYGKTSEKSFQFWAARAYWALGYGVGFFKRWDTDFARVLENQFLMIKKPLSKIMEQYGKYDIKNNRKYPVWLVNGSAADATSELLLGLIAYLEDHEDAELIEWTQRLAEGIGEMQAGENSGYPGAFLSWIEVWHAWGNSQSQVMASLGHRLEKKVWIDAAEREANDFYRLLLDLCWIHEIDFQTHRIERYPQITYDVRPVVSSLVTLAKVTGKRQYGELAGLSAAWLFGRNQAGQWMYDPDTGRAYDGIDSGGKINLNSGAESTIEAILCLLEVSGQRDAANTLLDWMESADQSNSNPRLLREGGQNHRPGQ